MIVEGDYFYKGALRLSWGFGSPNQLGAFVASALPMIWGLFPARNSQTDSKARQVAKPQQEEHWPILANAVLLLLEFSLWLLIGATASRGAAVAAVGAGLGWVLFGLAQNRETWRKALGWFSLRVVMCILGLAVFSFGGRIAPGFLTHDDSIGNRFILWKGAATLIAASPWSGWGVGESGNAFMQWVQTLDRPEAYKTMVNSFLHVGVERGLPGLGLLLVLTLLGGSWALVWEKCIQPVRLRLLVRAASCVLLSWALSNVFSTLFKDWRLWIFPVLALTLQLGSLYRVRISALPVVRWIGLSLVGALLVCGLVFFIGVRSDVEHAIHLKHPSRALVILTHGENRPTPRWGMLIDEDILGRRYGQEIRRWGANSAGPEAAWGVTVYDGRFWQPEAIEVKGTDQWILMGETAREADKLGSGKTIVFIHPRGQPPANWNGKGLVIFNGIDEEGSREAWVQWASRKRLRIETVSAIGLDIRAKWPAAYLADFESEP